jgi:hypothetical protein
MAKAKGPSLLSGKIQGLVYKVRNDQQIVQQAPREYKYKGHGPAYTLNKDEFAGAAKLAQSIYRRIKAGGFSKGRTGNKHHKLGPIFRPYSQNYLTAQIKQKADLEGKRHYHNGFHYATEIRFYDLVRALKGLDLSNLDAPSGHVSFTPLGPQHNPTAIKVMGLQDAANNIHRHGNARLEVRFHIRQCEITELAYDCETREWNPIESDLPVAPTSKSRITGPSHASEPSSQKGKSVQNAADDRHQLASSSKKAHASQPTDWIPVEILPEQGITLPIPKDRWLSSDMYLTTVMVEWRQIKPVTRTAERLHKQGIVRIAALHGPEEAWQRPANRITPPPKVPKTPRPKTTTLRIDPYQDPEAFLAQAVAKLDPDSPPEAVTS